MIEFRRFINLHGTARSVHDSLHRLFRVRVTRSHGGTFDEDVVYPHVAWTGRGGRSVVNIVLSGSQRVRCGDSRRWLGPGGVVGSRLDDTYSRELGDPLVLLTIDWEPGSLGTREPEDTVGSLSHGDMARLADLASAIEKATGEQLDVACAELLSALRAIGLPFDAHASREYSEAADIQAQPFASALSDTLSRLDERPTLVDLENALGMSRRGLHRKVTALTQRYGLNAIDWRSMLDRWRLSAAAFLLSSSTARTEHVARAVGYSHARVLCDSFRAAGLPRPLQLRAVVAEHA